MNPRDRGKRTARAIFAALSLSGLVLAVVWGVYYSLVPTPARDQLASTHGALIGRWRGHAMQLEIRPDATVRVHDGTSRYSGKVWRFRDRDFSLWVFPVIPAHFHVDVLPERDTSGDEWLVVDGHRLQRERP